MLRLSGDTPSHAGCASAPERLEWGEDVHSQIPVIPCLPSLYGFVFFVTIINSPHIFKEYYSFFTKSPTPRPSFCRVKGSDTISDSRFSWRHSSWSPLNPQFSNSSPLYSHSTPTPRGFPALFSYVDPHFWIPGLSLSWFTPFGGESIHRR